MIPLSRRPDDLVEAARLQGRLCLDVGAPTYAAILDDLSDDLRGRTVTAAARLALEDGGDPVGSALWLRLLGAVHRLVLARPEGELARYYPSVGGTADPARAVPAFRAFVDAHLGDVAAGMGAPVQTNEVGRAAALSAGLNHLRAAGLRSVRLFEIGASAGLNLVLDRYRVDAGGGRAWGPPDSPVVLAGFFRDGHPPTEAPEVVDRAGCDPQPVDLADPATPLLLKSFVWPEHVERMRRLEAALALGVQVAVERDDALTWLRGRLAPGAKGATVVYHSVVLPYLERAERSELRRTMEQAGSRADGDSPLAWMRLEPTRAWDGLELRVRTWPGGEDTLLAHCTPHGEQIVWKAPSP